MAISISETGFVEAKLEPSRCSLTPVILPSSAQAGNGKPTPPRNVSVFRKVSETLHLYSLGVCRRETFRFGEKKRTFFAKNV